MTIAPPGYYPAQGDPSGTVRYWDGEQWSAEAMPPPPGYDPNRSATTDRYATVWVRIGAVVLDGLITISLVLPFMIGWLGDVFDTVDAGGDAADVAIPTTAVLVGLVSSVAFVLMVGYLGGTPGKLMLGLRVTKADGATTPPGLGPAARRWIPNLAGAIPVVGTIIVIGVGVANIIMVNTDPERRSVHDRTGDTRVVYKHSL